MDTIFTSVDWFSLHSSHVKVDLTMFDQEESDQSLERLCDLLERYRTWTQILQPQVPFFPPLSYSFPYYPLDVFFFFR